MQNILKDPAFLSSVIETMSDGLMVVDRKGSILFFNTAAEKITGYRRDEVVGRQCTLLSTSACVMSTAEGKEKRCGLFEDQCVSERKCHIVTKDGRTVHIIKNAVVLKDSSGEVIGAVEAMTDVTSLYLKELEVEELRKELSRDYDFLGLVGSSQAMRQLQEQIQNAAMSEAPVTISGESGTGKELVARAIHRLSRRAEGPFVTVNCAALNEFLLESELFGHVKGAFTGAVKDRRGRLEAAQGGSLFLDEIGDMSASMQVKLLRVLQEKELQRVGDNRTVKVDARLITATNRDLCRLMEQGLFREDLFYRVNVIPIHTPALRDRMEDVPQLMAHYLKRVAAVNRKELKNVSRSAMEAIQAYHWPGNVRQIINAVEYAAITAKGETIEADNLPEYVFQKAVERERNDPEARKKRRVLEALERHRWSRTSAAKDLGVSRVTLWKMMKELGVRDEG